MLEKKIINDEIFKQSLEQHIQDDFFITLLNIQVNIHRVLSDEEKAQLMKEFKIGFLKGVRRALFSIPDYRDIVSEMIEEVEKTNII